MPESFNRISNPLEHSFEPAVQELGEWLDGIEAYLKIQSDFRAGIVEQMRKFDAVAHQISDNPLWKGWKERDENIQSLKKSLENLLTEYEGAEDRIRDAKENAQRVITDFKKHWLRQLNS